MGLKVGSDTPLFAFFRGSFPLQTHVGLAVTWMIGLYGSLFGMNHQTWQLDGIFFSGLISLFLMLFFLRGVDEIKDLPYDTIYNPDRPLVTGVVTIKNIIHYLIVAGVVLIALNSLVSLTAVMMISGILAYSLFLLVLEKYWPGFSDNLLLNALFSHPLHIAKNIYIWVLFYQVYPAMGIREILLIFTYSLGFFHFEFTRKAIWPDNLKPGERSYSLYLGGWGMVAAIFITGFSAAVIQVLLFQPWHESSFFKLLAAWLPMAGVVVGWMNLAVLIKNRSGNLQMKGKASFYYGIFHQILALYGIMACSIVDGLLK